MHQADLEDLTYLYVRMIDEDKGVRISTRYENGKIFPECFVGKSNSTLFPIQSTIIFLFELTIK